MIKIVSDSPTTEYFFFSQMLQEKIQAQSIIDFLSGINIH